MSTRTTPETAEGAEPKANDENAAPVPEDEDAKLMTLDEYKSLQKETRYKAEVNVRKAGENEDQTKWKNTRRYERPVAMADEDSDEILVSVAGLFSWSVAAPVCACQLHAASYSRKLFCACTFDIDRRYHSM